MAYNQLAEQWATNPTRQMLLFIDLAENTPSDAEIYLPGLIGQLPRIAHYAPKTQIDILRAMMKKMSAEGWEGDRLVRVRVGVYRWQCRDWASET